MASTPSVASNISIAIAKIVRHKISITRHKSPHKHGKYTKPVNRYKYSKA
jgi:hypothetical protein